MTEISDLSICLKISIFNRYLINNASYNSFCFILNDVQLKNNKYILVNNPSIVFV